MAYTRFMGVIKITKRAFEIVSRPCINKTIYSISVYNAILHEDCFNNISNIIKDLTVGEELFFGFYRIDGLTLTKREFEECGQMIPQFFNENGEYREITQTITNWRGITKTYQGMLTVARASYNQKLLDNIKWILQYYLETTIFVPNLSFDEFEQIYSGYIKNGTVGYLEKNYMDFEFSYYDSGHFSIYFNPNKVNIDYVEETVKKYFYTT